MPDFKAAIFDLDGTLIDSMRVWKKIDVDFLAKRSLTVPETYAKEICSKNFIEAAEYTINLFGLKESAGDIMEEWNRMAMDEYSHHIRLKPHVKEYLTFLKEQGIRLAVATASPEALYGPVLKNNGVYGLFDAFVSTGEVARGKAYPDVYLLAARKLGVLPGDCVVYEDIPEGIAGAKAAGMKAFGVYDAHCAHEKAEIEALADGFICDFIELLPHSNTK